MAEAVRSKRDRMFDSFEGSDGPENGGDCQTRRTTFGWPSFMSGFGCAPTVLYSVCSGEYRATVKDSRMMEKAGAAGACPGAFARAVTAKAGGIVSVRGFQVRIR